MSKTELFIDRAGPLLRAAVVDNGRLTDLHIDNANRPSLLGAVFLGKVERIVPAMDAAFIDLGTGKAGLLSVSDVRPAAGKGAKIGAALRGGQPVLVQVKADATGDKGPGLTMDVTLPGRFLVHAPYARGLTVSKRLGQGAARAELVKRLQVAVVGGGWIARSTAAMAEPALLGMEAEALAVAWREIGRAATGATAPARLRDGPDAVRRAVVEAGRALSRIRVVGDDLARDLKEWAAEAAPDLAGRIETASPSLFDTYDVEGDIARLMGPRVPLSGGGSLVIEKTEALTVVDVNAGERGNALAVNLEAAAEIARQLRLRNAGGIVVVDFVNMHGRGDGERVLQALTTAVADDPVQTQVYGISRLGLVEMTRARRGAALLDLLAGAGALRGED
ncbi:MAG TPA: ribonuclease E/G [Azospirillaceae bacterium]|nr:ribonuclease E/G [Azospirillaceae bacterium]